MVDHLVCEVRCEVLPISDLVTITIVASTLVAFQEDSQVECG